MEDAVDALKIATCVFLFLLALAIVFTMFSQARDVSDIVINYNDNTYFASYTEANGDNQDGRTVGIETVIPTLYGYYKEKYSVDIIDKYNSENNEKFDEEIERKVYSSLDKSYKDNYGALYKDGISWLKRSDDQDTYYKDIQNRVSAYIDADGDAEINGTILKSYKVKGLENNKDRTIIETFHKVDNTPEGYLLLADDGTILELQKGTTKMYITYTLY